MRGIRDAEGAKDAEVRWARVMACVVGRSENAFLCAKNNTFLD